uniref:Uncharacterized protein n=1 Tax=Acrobeloides nanus TaxID=290746 RepID=A0A914CRP7_9BILA
MSNFILTPTNSDNYGPNFACNWTIITNVNSSSTLQIIPSIPQFSYFYMDMYMDNCNGGSRRQLQYTLLYDRLYFQEEKICIYFNSSNNATGDQNWLITFALRNATPTKSIINITEPIMAWPLYADLNLVTGYSVLTFQADHGTLEMFFLVWFKNVSYNGTFYVYDSDKLMNLDYISTPRVAGSGWQYFRATNRSISILFVGNDFSPQDGTMEIVARIVEDHSKNCNETYNLSIVESDANLTMAALPTGSCIYSIYVPYYNALNISKLSYKGNDIIRFVRGYSAAQAQILFEF